MCFGIKIYRKINAFCTHCIVFSSSSFLCVWSLPTRCGLLLCYLHSFAKLAIKWQRGSLNHNWTLLCCSYLRISAELLKNFKLKQSKKVEKFFSYEIRILLHLSLSLFSSILIFCVESNTSAIKKVYAHWKWRCWHKREVFGAY